MTNLESLYYFNRFEFSNYVIYFTACLISITNYFSKDPLLIGLLDLKKEPTYFEKFIIYRFRSKYIIKHTNCLCLFFPFQIVSLCVCAKVFP